MFTTQNNLPEDVRTQVAALLNQALADLSDLYSQTKQAHWNVRGKLFYQLHKLFDELAAGVEEHLDELAERITALGGFARGTIRQAAAQTRLEEFPDAQATDLGYVEVLTERFARCANETRIQVDEADELGDADTADLLTAISRNLDKSLWMLEAHMRKL
jgi:starvation-inducible DNA-binding protein